ncbi:hypothetical protein [Celeribacter indicus]|uniref:Uncharacterized protein n=2 Tax=Celeribacter indicus TaxID=1208324 RepID=A0A0B5DY95_9RHOB|nr:hypothetical protein [Celeribacter indicus]AJE46140.1 hypothetical protein P73_1425 [Celeribacter indicus]SDX37002.1 hypothetical protein SAMN05443573_12429 [Celeribacter indicus]
MDLVWSQRIADAYPALFPRRLRQAHAALVSRAEEANPDGWPTPSDVERFARLYGVPRGTLGGLVGMLSRQVGCDRRAVWVDAVRDPDAATPHLIRQHDHKVVRAFGWFCATTDLGWLRLREPVLH